MEIFVLGHQMMGQKGSSLLKLIQNCSLPTIDLLVRESIQNSMDASQEGSQKTRVEFMTGSCERERLDEVFVGISGALRERIPGDTADFIALRDCETTGLTGPLRESELEEGVDIGNLRKLIYEISCPQPGEGKGGSWGLGKTVYFRVGIGIVLYYSRIRTEDGYASRMAAALIEDETKSDSLLRQSGQQAGKLFCGVAWWGQNDGSSTMPITGEEEIEEILDIFGVAPYEGEETGTTILIPYVDRARLCKNANVQNKAELSNNGLEQFIWLAMQRWYMPRLDNKNYEFGPYMDFRLNGKKMRPAEYEPFFKAVQELYDQGGEEGSLTISLRGDFTNGGKAGWLAYRKLSRSELEMVPPDNRLSPYVLLHQDESEQTSEANPVIVCYCRQPGMIVNYEIDTAWTAGIMPTGKDEVLLAVFCLNSNGDQQMLADDQLTLEEYVRTAEPADHMSWHDQEIGGQSCQVVDKMRRQIARKLVEATADQSKRPEKHTDMTLQRRMGELFLPPSGFGRLSGGARPHRGGGSTQSRGSREPVLSLETPVFEPDQVCTLDWELTLHYAVEKLVIEVTAVTEGNELTAENWEDEDKGLGKVFPFAMLHTSCDDEGVQVPAKELKSERGQVYGVLLDLSGVTVGKKKTLHGKVSIHGVDDTLGSNLRIGEVTR